MLTESSAVENDEELNQLIQLGGDLIHAILTGSRHSDIQDLIAAGAPVWFQDAEGWSPLHAAAQIEDVPLVKSLIEQGAIWNAELLLHLLSSKDTAAGALVLRPADIPAFGSVDAFLSTQLRYTKDEQGQEICLLRAGGVDIGVMMGWERGIMYDTVQHLTKARGDSIDGVKVLNVGFGLGIIDTFFQELSMPPALHVIIEPHDDVLRHMRELGWYDRKGVKILEGKWQDFINQEELLGIGGFDVIYTDTFSENYYDLQQFFGHVPKLLAGSHSVFSFFNGLGATNPMFYDIYTHLSELHLANVGFDVTWSDVDIRIHEIESRWGHTREYFTVGLYRLPICQLQKHDLKI